MERLLNPYDRESMKMIILKHEETFKEQVFELHRVYRIQKILMKNMRSNGAHLRESRTNGSEVNYINKEQQMRRRVLDLERPAEEFIMDESGNGVLEIEDENDIELTLGPARVCRRKKDMTPLDSDTGPSLSSSSTESNFMQRRSTSNHRRADRREELRVIQVPNLNPSFPSGKNAFDVADNLRPEKLNQPPWLFQVLSLNMT